MTTSERELTKHRRGFSLVEAVIMTALLAVIFVPIASLFPTGVLSLKRAEDRQTAVYLAKEYIEEARAVWLPNLPAAVTASLQLNETAKSWTTTAEDTPLISTREMNKTIFTITRRVWAIRGKSGLPPSLIDVLVMVEFPMSPVPVTISTRYYRE